jgi:hypothetical protein
MTLNDFVNDLLMQSILKICFYKDKDHQACLFQKQPHSSLFPEVIYIIINNQTDDESYYYYLAISHQFSN